MRLIRFPLHPKPLPRWETVSQYFFTLILSFSHAGKKVSEGRSRGKKSIRTYYDTVSESGVQGRLFDLLPLAGEAYCSAPCPSFLIIMTQAFSPKKYCPFSVTGNDNEKVFTQAVMRLATVE